MLWLLAVLAAAAVVWVLQPALARAPADAGGGNGAASNRALRLAERRDQLLLAIAELDFEKDAGKVSPEEHERSRAALLAEAGDVVAALDAERDGTRRRRRS